MGRYINSNSKGEPAPAKGKAEFLIADGAREITVPHFRADLVCVVENGMFDAALYCESIDDYMATRAKGDHRPRRYLVYEHAHRLA